MTNYNTRLLLFLLISFTFFSCSEDENTVETVDEIAKVCTIDNSSFKQLYDNILQTDPLANEINDLDIEVHGYTFEVSSDKQICSIGYQNYGPNTPYKIEIIDNSNNTQVYYGEHIFSSTAISYVQLSTPVDIYSNSTYTIKRIQDVWSSIGEVSGKALQLNDNSQTYDFLPYTFGDLTIITGGVQDVVYNPGGLYQEETFRFPLIDIVFLE